MRIKLFFLSVCFFTACRTVSIPEYGSKLSSVTIKLPSSLAAFDAKATFSRADAIEVDTVAKGTDLRIRLGFGLYAVNLEVYDKAGKKVYESCDPKLPRKIDKARVSLSIEVCRLGQGEPIARTIPSGEESDVEVTPVLPAARSLTTASIEYDGSDCFGQKPSFMVVDNNLIISLKKPISGLLSLTERKYCRLGMRMTKPEGMTYAKIGYAADMQADTTAAQINLLGLYLSGNDSNKAYSLNCDAIFVKDAVSGSNKSYCDNNKPLPDLPVFNESKLGLKTSCSSRSELLDLTLYVGAVTKDPIVLEGLTISQIRIPFPTLVKCE